MGGVISSGSGTAGNFIGGITNPLENNLGVTSTVNTSPYQVNQAQYNQNYSNEQALAQQLLAQNAGQGPNPALSQLAQTTSQNIAQSAGTVASQKGLNPALAARLAGQNAANTNQQANAQAATLYGQQILGNEANLANLYGNMNQQQLNENALLSGNYNAAQNLNLNQAQQNAATRQQILGGALQGIGSAGSQGGSAGSGLSAAGGAIAASQGGKIGGKAEVEGDSLENDKVPAMLSPGEIVVPRSKAEDPEMAKAFIDHLMKNEKGNSQPSFSDVIASHKKMTQKLAELEKRIGSRKNG